jgi:hypothetical protein
MNKHLINSEQEYITLFKGFEVYDAEDFLGVEFAFVDGKYQSDQSIDYYVDELQSVSRTIYRKTDYSVFPEEYPCLVLLANERDSDRFGPTAFKMLDFVYIKDFLPKS